MVVMLSVEKVRFAYPGQDEFIFKEVSFSVDKGSVVCILGANGIGKSTLIKCLAGIYDIQEGSVSVRGRNIHQMKRDRVATLIGYVPQFHQPVFSFTVMEIVLMGRSAHIGMMSSPSSKDRQIAAESLYYLGIEHLAEKSYDRISGGERQLVMVARVLAQQSQLILLDEPTAHLDFGNQIQVLHLIDRLANDGLTVVMTSHFPDHTFMVADRVALMAKGGLLDFGHPDKVVTEETLKSIYRIRSSIIRGPDGRKICVPSFNNRIVSKNSGET